uniref:Class I helical cytokine receptor number 19 n=1 Tax=Tetraodon nigroviridis TaxID=99883 RepID=Q6UAN7_TETNG|nr:class I helical cytokine receptor number 19 [Tetraodon nigroviridis]
MAWLLVALFALSFTAAEAEQLPPPTGLTRNWLDPITVVISWEEPRGLPANASISYLCTIRNKEKKERSNKTIWKLFTEETDSDHWNFQVQTVSEDKQHNGQKKYNNSSPVTFNISHDKQKAELVKDFKCVIDARELNCSWIPANPSQNLTVRYRMDGFGDEVRHGVKTCDNPSGAGDPGRHSCTLQRDVSEIKAYSYLKETCVFVETDTAVSTFRPQLVVNPPLVNVTEENDTLKVTLASRLPGLEECTTFTLRYERCSVQEYRNITGYNTMDISYDKTCRYEFRAQTLLGNNCFGTALASQFSDPVTYGVDNPDRTLAIAATFISIVLSVCIILLCYCFRKHKKILWPNIPDPSVIFKQMMNGNNDLKAPGGNLYTPVPEHFSPLQIRTAT